MHTISEAETSTRTTPTTDRVRVAVAGATGYTGQELLRLLARHPHVSIVAATSSGATAARTLPALARIWTGTVTPLDPERLTAEADLVFLALPDTAAAELAPSGLVLHQKGENGQRHQAADDDGLGHRIIAAHRFDDRILGGKDHDAQGERDDAGEIAVLGRLHDWKNRHPGESP